MRLKDQLNNEVSLESVPRRIISLVPSLTELLCDLGLAGQIVGVTKFCVHPENIRQKSTVIGGTKKVHLDECMALKPDFVLASKEENIEHQVNFFQEKGIVVYTSDIKVFDDLKDLVNDLGQIFQIESKAQRLSSTIDDHLKQLKNFQLKKDISATYLIWKDPYMAAGGDTFISHMLAMTGIDNALAHEKRYPTVSVETLKEKSGDVILLSSEPFPFKASHVEEIAGLTGKKVILVDGEFFSWYGSRILHMKDYLKQLTSQL